ncbi:hypothetical protein NYO67_3684 [Aspergillus flavus]|nr:hypothetical protein NYO67_3684 [Aspergillus flavus]
MAELTVGYVSGIIAAAVFLVRVFVPTVICLVVIGHLPEENTIVSWSVVSRLIHSSYWPTILNSDTAASTGVSRAINACNWLQLGALGLVAITGIVTPLGLYDTIGPDDTPTNIPFRYASDISAFGKATRSRDGYRSLRVCYADEDPNTDEGCPGAPPNINDIEDPAEAYSIWPSSVDLFTSGKVPSTVSSLFDIQWRSFRSTTNVALGVNGSAFSEGYYRQISQFIMEEGIIAVEGLIVDTKAGRIGFRNHTVPVDVPTGARWTEDILFIEPEARCVNTNLTVDYRYNPSSETYDSFEDTRDPVLVDHGGFSNLPHAVYEIDTANFQNNVALYERAYSAAWRHNMALMQFFNVTTNGSDGLAPFAYMNSEVGKKFDLRSIGSSYIAPVTVQTDSRYAGFLELPFPNQSTSSSLRDRPEGPNPVNLTAQDTYAIAQEACHYPSMEDLSNLSFVGVSCGTVFAAPGRLDGDPLIPDTNSTWSTPIYSCAAAAKAAIRKVTFRFNGTGELDNLEIERIERSSKPQLWGVERLANHTIRNVRPLWGIVSPEVGTRDDISTVERDHLWLPGYPDTSVSDLYTGQANMPGSQFYMDRLLSLFGVRNMEKSTSRYTGLNDLALYSQWLELSNSSSGVEHMLKLMWTDMAANTVVGTRGWHSPKNGERLSKRDSGEVNVPVTLWSQHIEYRLPYAIPAFILLALCIALGAWSIWLLILRRVGLKQMRTYLARTSPGRILGHALHEDQGNILASTDVWLQQIGLRKVTLPGRNEDSEIPLLDVQRTLTHEDGGGDKSSK